VAHVVNAFRLRAGVILGALSPSVLGDSRLADDARGIIRISRAKGYRHHLDGRFDGQRAARHPDRNIAGPGSVNVKVVIEISQSQSPAPIAVPSGTSLQRERYDVAETHKLS
jgi:hypothetical protein